MIIDMGEASEKIRKQFEAGVNVIQNLPKNGSFKPSNELLLKFYGYYKQATLGQCNTPRPGFFDMVGRAKWDAWNALGAMTKEDAMQGYVVELKQIVEVMPQTDEVNTLVKELDHFYELVDIHTGEPILSEESASLTEAQQEKLPEETTQHGSKETRPLPYIVAENTGDINSLSEGTGSVYFNQTSEDVGAISRSRVHLGSLTSIESNEDEDTDNELYMDSSDFIHPDATVTVQGHVTCGAEKSGDTSVLQDCSSDDCLHDQDSRLEKLKPVSSPAEHLSESLGVFQADLHSNQRNVSSVPQRETGVNDVLRSAIKDLREQMAAINQRLTLVEKITIHQRREQLTVDRKHRDDLHYTSLADDTRPRSPFWWPFKSLEPRTVLIVLLWPVFVSWIISYLSRRRPRR